MTKMFIANCTPQVNDFNYRLPENAKLMKQSIDPYGQIQVSGELSTPDIEAIIQQHSIYGMVHISEVDRTRDFTGLCFQLDKKINVDQIRKGVSQHTQLLDARGKILRQEAAVAVNQSIENSGGPARIEALEMSIEEEPHKDRPDTHINETVRVTRKEKPTPAAPTRGRRAA